MKKKIAASVPWSRDWKRLGVAALLLGALLAPPAFGADPAPATGTTAGTANLNFVGADIDTVIKAIGQYTNITFVIDPRVKGTISLVSEKPVSKSQAFQMLTSALRLQGYAVVMSEGYAKVVPEADAKLQVSPTQSGALRGDQIATRIYRLNYESAANLVAVLRPLISPNNTINANPGTNSLVITDYADNLQRLGKIIAALDAPTTSDFDVVPVQHAIAADIAMMVNRLMESAVGGGAAPGAADSGRVSLLADPRTNSVIIRAPSVARANLAKSLVAKLDLPTAQAGNVHVIYLKNADASKLALTLRAVVTSDTSAAGAGQPAAAAAPTGAPSSGLNTSAGGMQSSGPSQSQPANLGPLPSGGAAGFIQADVATNSLIITASEPVYRNLRSVVDQLDARRAQVYIESLIAEVTSTNADALGVQWAGLSGNSSSSYRVGTITGFSTAGDNLIGQIISQATTGKPLATPPSNGLNLGIFRQINGALGLGAIAHALESMSNTNILSMPNLITLDNEEARIIVGQNVPFLTGSYATQASGGAAGVNPFQTIERKDIGVSLRVRPQVSEGGSVKMAIYQETSALQPTPGVVDIVTSKRSLETSVLVDDGQIVVLGGLIEDTVNDGVEKVPGLGDIPVVGNLFKYKTRSRAKTNLMIFLRPTVIRDNQQSVNVAADRYEFIRNQQIAQQPEPTIVLTNMGAPVLPPLHNGRMIDGQLYNSPDVQDGAVRPIPQEPLPPLTPQPPAPDEKLLN
ncbi:MAG TPA: type II secretion system secretin GspD [Burkholderiaceae bacterium]|nr:type II secretion system secretin GspD [Burkholderiaceae bacterium]